MPRALLAVLLLGTLSCGPERRFSGQWQQVCGVEAPCPDGWAYELHLGRYGDNVAGLLVRYAAPREGLDPFAASGECGCFFLEGGRVVGDGLRFGLFEPENPGRPGPDFEWSDACAPASAGPEPPCTELFVALDGDSDLLEGTLDCGEGGRSRAVTFSRVGSSPRRNCELPGR